MPETTAIRRPAGLMRRINNLIWESLDNGGRTLPVAFFCECADGGCYRSVWLAPAEYERRRGDAQWLALADGHRVGEEAPGV